LNHIKLIPLLLLTLLFISITSIASSNTTYTRLVDHYGFSETTSIGGYSLKSIWKTNISSFFGNTITVFYDLDNDGMNDLLIFGYNTESFNSSIIAVSGNSSIAIILELPMVKPFDTSPSAVDIINDANGDGYPEVVLLFSSIDFLENNTYIGFITWQPVGNKFVVIVLAALGAGFLLLRRK
jgi:hypothetical protein